MCGYTDSVFFLDSSYITPPGPAWGDDPPIRAGFRNEVGVESDLITGVRAPPTEHSAAEGGLYEGLSIVEAPVGLAPFQDTPSGRHPFSKAGAPVSAADHLLAKRARGFHHKGWCEWGVDMFCLRIGSAAPRFARRMDDSPGRRWRAWRKSRNDVYGIRLPQVYPVTVGSETWYTSGIPFPDLPPDVGLPSSQDCWEPDLDL